MQEVKPSVDGNNNLELGASRAQVALAEDLHGEKYS